MKMATMKSGLGALALLPGLAMAAPAVADKADNAFMMICTALVLFMTIPWPSAPAAASSAALTG